MENKRFRFNFGVWLLIMMVAGALTGHTLRVLAYPDLAFPVCLLLGAGGTLFMYRIDRIKR